MTLEEKDLLLKDLCIRLPYGVKILIQDTFKYSIVSSERHVLDISNFSDIFSFKYKELDKRMKKAMRERPDYIVIKPYLFPLSSMTEEEHAIYFKIWEDTGKMAYLEGCHHLIATIKAYKAANDYLLSKHYDVNGLIPIGAAIDATGLNIY